MRRVFCAVGLLVCLLLSSCNRDPNAARDRCVASGNKYFEKGKYRQASILYRRALQLDPKCADAYYHLGLVSMRLGNVGDALRAYQRASELDPSNEDAAVRLAEIYVAAYFQDPTSNKRALNEAKPLVERLLKQSPKSYDALRLSGDLAAAENDLKTAIQRLREANEVKPWQPETMLALMKNLVADGQGAEAEGLALAMTAQRKTQPEAYDFLYAYYMQRALFDRAEQILKTKIANLPSDSLSRLQLAYHNFDRRRRPEMLAALDALRSDRKTFPDADLMIGDFYVRIGEFEPAIESYREGQRTDPKRSALYGRHIAEVLAAEGRDAEALQIVSRLEKENPEDREAVALRASLQARGDPKQVQAAINSLEQLAAKEPQNPMLQLNLGRVYLAKGDSKGLDQAQAHFESSLKLKQDFLPAKLALAQLQLARGQNADAVRGAEEILKTSPTNLAARLVRSAGLANLGNRDRARAELTGILSGRPDSTEARFQLAWLDFGDKHYADAELNFLALVRAGDPRGILGLARCKQAQGKLADAVRLLQDELAKLPDRNDLRLALMEVEYGANRFQDARAELEHLIRNRPDSAELYLRLADVDNRLGDTAGAVANFRKARQLNPSDASAALGLAVMLTIAGQRDQARSAYEDVLKIDPDNVQALNNFAYLKAEDGMDLDQALGMAQRALRIEPANPNFADTLALIYVRKKLSSEAVRMLQDLVSRVPDNPSFHLHLAMALYDTGDKQLAKRELQTALRYKPSEAEQIKIRELVSRIG